MNLSNNKISMNSFKEIPMNSFEREIFHHTGKIVKSWFRDNCSKNIYILFEDGMEGRLSENSMIQGVEIRPIPINMCKSCGERRHASIFDRQGRCKTSVKNFWKKVHKVYWHRYSKNK